MTPDQIAVLARSVCRHENGQGWCVANLCDACCTDGPIQTAVRTALELDANRRAALTALVKTFMHTECGWCTVGQSLCRHHRDEFAAALHDLARVGGLP